MSGTEILVVVFGLFIGYWIVSKFSGGTPVPKQEQARPEADPVRWHEVLQISPEAEVEEIRAAYKSLMSQYHPDKVASLGPELRQICERKSKEINIAYDQAMKERGVAA